MKITGKGITDPATKPSDAPGDASRALAASEGLGRLGIEGNPMTGMSDGVKSE